MCKYLKGGYKGDRYRFFPVVFSDGREAMGANKNTGSSIPTSGTLFDLEGDQVLAQVGQGIV